MEKSAPMGQVGSWLSLVGSLIFFVAGMTVVAPIPTPTGPRLVLIQEALARGEISAWLEPLFTGYRQPMMSLRIQNRTGDTMLIQIPSGTIINATNNQLADLIVGQEAEMHPVPEAQTNLVTYSLAFSKAFPSVTDVIPYTVGAVSDFPIQELLQNISKSNREKEWGAQLAVWSKWNNLTPNQVLAQLPANRIPNAAEAQAEAESFLGIVVPNSTSTSTPFDIPVTPFDISVTPFAPNTQVAAVVTAQPTVTPDGAKQSASSFVITWIIYAVIGFIVFALVLAFVLTRRSAANQTQLKPPPPKSLPSRLDQPPVENRPHNSAGNSNPSISNDSDPSAPPSDLTRVREGDAETRHSMSPRLVLVGSAGPLRDQHFDIVGDCVLTRESFEWIRLPLPDISVPHAALDLTDKIPSLHDLASSNGVYVDKMRLGKEYEPVTQEQIIQLGKDSQCRIVGGGTLFL